MLQEGKEGFFAFGLEAQISKMLGISLLERRGVVAKHGAGGRASLFIRSLYSMANIASFFGRECEV